MDSKKLAELLRDKYGITTLSQLNKAIAAQKNVDLSVFVSTDGLNAESKNERGKKNELPSKETKCEAS